jgi:hypothetical protein
MTGSRSTLAAKLVVPALLAALSPWSCSSSTSNDETPDPPGDAGVAWGTSACASCVAGACAAEIDACSHEPTCAAHLTCLRACPLAPDGNVDEACEAACPKGAGSVGEAAISALADCRRAGAGTACTACGFDALPDAAGEDGGCRGDERLCQVCAPSVEAEECPRCEDENCCDTYAACKSDPLCDAYAQCMRSCTLPSFRECMEQCDRDVSPAGFAKFSTRLGCVFALCMVECGAGEPCSLCVADHCREEKFACDAHEPCARLEHCVGTCEGSALCIDDCNNAFPEGRELAAPLDECGLRNCLDPCS